MYEPLTEQKAIALAVRLGLLEKMRFFHAKKLGMAT